jgi:hypothetical protein
MLVDSSFRTFSCIDSPKTAELLHDGMDHVFYGIFTGYICLEKYSNAALIS